jgi:glycine/D-amino acid oxidase-like deaminating enzyme
MAGIELEWMNATDVRDHFGFTKPAGLLSTNGAEIDPYLLTHSLFRSCITEGMKVYDHTEISGITHTTPGIVLTTTDAKKIRARKLVIACGYESQRYIPKTIQHLHSTYVIISEPLGIKDFWYKNSLIWETAQPYIYLRTTYDGRIIIGGKDIPSSNPRLRDSLLLSKTKALERSFAGLFPSLRFKTDFKWAGSFGTTRDSLPYIGSIPQRPDTYFALGLGGNGITFSVVAAQIIRDLLAGRATPDAKLFSFQR